MYILIPIKPYVTMGNVFYILIFYKRENSTMYIHLIVLTREENLITQMITVKLPQCKQAIDSEESI